MKESSWYRFKGIRFGTHVLLPSLICLLTAAAQAQFTFITNNGALTIIRYTGAGGVVEIPSATNGLPVVCIGGMSFLGNTNVTNVIIPASVTSIESGAFISCKSLNNITIPDGVTAIVRSTFFDCTALTNVIIGSGVTNIGSGAFSSCTSLTSITIPNSVTSIGSYAFSSCTSLTNAMIGNSVTELKSGAFSRCTNLTEIYFRGNAPGYYEVFDDATNVTVYYLPNSSGWFPIFGDRPTALWKPTMLTGDSCFDVRTNQFGFNISWASGMAVAVDACTNFSDPIWTPLQTNTLTGDTLYFSDPQWTNYPNRFYRLRWP